MMTAPGDSGSAHIASSESTSTSAIHNPFTVAKKVEPVVQSSTSASGSSSSTSPAKTTSPKKTETATTSQTSSSSSTAAAAAGAKSASPTKDASAPASSSTQATESSSSADAGESGEAAGGAGESVESESTAEYEPVVKLDVIETKSGEEDEEELYKQSVENSQHHQIEVVSILQCVSFNTDTLIAFSNSSCLCERIHRRSALYRFDAGANEWKERGKGDVKLLKHKTTGKIRILLRQDKTLKVCLNHLLQSELELKPNAGSDRSWTWRCEDYSGLEPETQTFAIRFKDAKIAKEFQTKFDEVKKLNDKQ